MIDMCAQRLHEFLPVAFSVPEDTGVLAKVGLKNKQKEEKVAERLEVAERLMAERRQFSQLDDQEAMREYLKLLYNVPMYGCTYFLAKQIANTKLGDFDLKSMKPVKHSRLALASLESYFSRIQVIFLSHIHLGMSVVVIGPLPSL